MPNMPPSRPDDQSLLDRLNALKPTAVTLGKPANAATPPGPGAQPVSREDALAERLRTLRDQSGSRSRTEGISQGGDRPQPGIPNHGEAGKAAPPSVEPHSVAGGPASQNNVVSLAASVSQGGRNIADQKPSYHFVGSDVDDDEALDELLEALGDENFILAAEDDMEPALGDPRAEADKVNKLLKSLRNGPKDASSRGNDNPAEDDDDDSDGERMTRAVEKLLSQIGDEINALPQPTEAPAEDDNCQPGEVEAEPGAEPATKTASTDEGDEALSLALPAVPSQLVDPVPSTKPEDDFEKDISARLASLRGLGAVDELGLPSAPTFLPQDHAPTTTSGRGLLKSKYTDEDQETWCIVCLDDATIRCVGCDNDVYCARCWKEMHVGPSAGYDERGHQWVKFERTARP